MITLSPAYLRTLKNGPHEVTVTFTNGRATLPLEVELSEGSFLARAGDGTGPLAVTLVLTAAATAALAAALGVARRRLSRDRAL